MTKAERAKLENMKLTRGQLEMLLILDDHGYDHPVKTDNPADQRFCDALVQKGFAERNPTATKPREYRITEDGTARLYFPANLL